MSYGLHVGSVEPNVTGSLVLGGYDSSRCLTDPIVSSLDTVQLRNIALNVSSGGYAYLDTDSAYVPDLLRANGSTVGKISVYPRPGVPRLYLPKDTCDAIAAHLPVTYSSEFNLYLWDTEKQAYKDIVSSPHYLAFTFASDNGDDSTISVPFVLLNLHPHIANRQHCHPVLPLQALDARFHWLHSRQCIPTIRLPSPELGAEQALPRPSSRTGFPQLKHPEYRKRRYYYYSSKKPTRLAKLLVQHAQSATRKLERIFAFAVCHSQGR